MRTQIDKSRKTELDLFTNMSEPKKKTTPRRKKSVKSTTTMVEDSHTSAPAPQAIDLNDLLPKMPTGRAPHGIRTFTVCRQADQSGVSGIGIVVEGVIFATGHCVIHWLTPSPRGALAIWDSIDDFIKVHIKSHPDNNTIITFQDGETIKFPEDQN